ncbi:peptide/nickel transport system permease protein [Rhizobiales bacterium GAS191]|jgi:peptide/nickel transport system permease protein|nr:peptide/nickel transport system permease protein [Rhizobiales bacterium GAS113]SEC95838.1 peptide/nickel transport system permease protein [Rhizobiales bacterium GAS191]
MLKRLLLARLIDLAVVVIGVSIIVFLMIRLIPGDAVAIMLGANTEVTPEAMAQLRERIGLDQPLVVQYLRWAAAALHGDLGTSLWTGHPVAEEIIANIWPTLELTLLALVFGAGLAVPLGCLMAQYRGRWSDVAMRIGTVIGLTIPSFWLGIVLILLVSELAPGFASLGYVPFGEDPLGNLERMAMPALALALPILANLSRLVRSAMLDSLGQDFVRTARAKGAPERIVVYKHALRNALIPYVTSVGITAGYLLGGAIVVEQVFAIPGLGRLILGAITERNYPLIQATILVVTIGFVIVNFMIDLVYGLIDPRVRR